MPIPFGCSEGPHYIDAIRTVRDEVMQGGYPGMADGFSLLELFSARQCESLQKKL